MRRAIPIAASAFGILGLAILVLAGESGAFLPAYPDDADRFMRSRLRALGAPGMAAGIVRDGRLAWEGYYGRRDDENPVTEDTLFMIASISKTVVATAVMQLWEQGRFDLDDDVNDYLDFAVRDPRHPDDAVTIKHLMTHRSGIRDREPLYGDMYTIDSGGGDSPWPLGRFLKAYLVPGGEFYRDDNFTGEAPDARFEYTNYGAALLAYLVEVLTKENFAAYCREHIFGPLGMERTYYLQAEIPAGETEFAFPYRGGRFLPPYNYPDYPAGSVRTTVRDMARFVSAYMGEADGPLLKRKTIEKMFGTYGEATDLGEEGMGLLWVHMNWMFMNAVGHGGGDPGVSAFMLLYPEEDFAVLFMMNAHPLENGNPGKIIMQRGIVERLYQEASRLSKGSISAERP